MTQEWLWGTVLFAQSLLFGMALGLWYGFFRFLRLLFPHPNWVVAVEDVLFFLVASVAHVFFHFSFGEGETRWFAVFGVVLGFLFYLASLGRIARGAALWLKEQIAKLFLRPMRKAWRKQREKHRIAREKRKAKRQLKAEQKEKKKQEKEQKKKDRLVDPGVKV